jgi:hypothetical protein
METRFWLSDCQEPLEEILEAGTLGEKASSTHLRAEQRVDFEEKPYLSWADVRLTHEVELWIARYS